MSDRRTHSSLLAVLALLALTAGCGDDSGTGTTVAPTTTEAAATTAPATTAAPPATAATTTTAAATTTLPIDAHPTMGLSWSAVWPADGAQATYRALTYDGETVDVPARIDYGIEWEGGTWDRLTVGEADFGGTGAAFYFDRSEPWVIRIWGVESFFAELPAGQVQREWFDEPLVVDLTALPEGILRIEGTLNLAFSQSTDPDMQFGYTAEGTVVESDTIEVPAGSSGVGTSVQVRFALGGEFMGGATHESYLWVHETLFLIKWEETLAFRTIELLTPWG